MLKFVTSTASIAGSSSSASANATLPARNLWKDLSIIWRGSLCAYEPCLLCWLYFRHSNLELMPVRHFGGLAIMRCRESEAELQTIRARFTQSDRCVAFRVVRREASLKLDPDKVCGMRTTSPSFVKGLSKAADLALDSRQVLNSGLLRLRADWLENFNPSDDGFEQFIAFFQLFEERCNALRPPSKLQSSCLLEEYGKLWIISLRTLLQSPENSFERVLGNLPICALAANHTRVPLKLTEPEWPSLSMSK